ncbi:carbohydrate kinase family protein [Tessaracoccus sp. HDW20]|uniref:PfkB family carbohydrate kinase n=1 Tax=Tessaracoccus coleopterorum TaxID=2714950 RepID=UPI0018D2A418|nr:carbohydrate kinase family protein [Tessaracoccus coleopterorum]
MLTVGLTYRDLIFTGVEAMPLPGEERYASSLHEMWGGIATMARVSAALGSHTALATAVGSDPASRRLLDDMAAIGVDTSLTAHHEGWSLPVTVAMSLPTTGPCSPSRPHRPRIWPPTWRRPGSRPPP